MVPELWARAVEEGWTTAEIAALTGLSQRTIQRRLAAIRDGFPSSPESDPDDANAIPTLELSDSPAPTSTCCYHLPTDRISLDGKGWLDPTQTPSLAVLAPCGTGRRHRIVRLQAGTRTEPGGPTSHRQGRLKGGRR